jgi:electron transfer flavoprotein alpha subunit
MKTLLVGEYRDGKLLGSTYELVAFAEKLGADSAMRDPVSC